MFPQTPVTFRYFRRAGDQPYAKLNGGAYASGEIITERPVHLNDPTSVDYRLGSAKTLIEKTLPLGGTYNPSYLPLLEAPIRFE